MILLIVLGEVTVPAMASFFELIFEERLGVGKAPILYKMAISQNWEIVIWIADEYVRLCGFNQHDNQWSIQNGLTKLTLDEIASQLGTSKRDLQRDLR